MTDSGRGRHPSHVLAAVALAVMAIMMAAPFAVATDSYALTDGEAGYTIEVREGATDSELTAIGTSVKSILVSALDDTAHNINIPYSAQSGTAGKLTYSSAQAQKISGNTATLEMMDKVDAQEIDVTFKITYTTSIFDDVSYDTDSNVWEAQQALKTFLGIENFQANDLINFRGSLEITTATSFSTEYEDVNETKCVQTEGKEESAVSEKADLTITYTPNGGGEPKTFKYTSKLSGKSSMSEKLTYETDFADIKEGDKCDIRESVSVKAYDRSMSYEIDGDSYSIYETPYSGDYDWMQSVDIEDKEDIVVYPVYTPAVTSDHVTTTVSYADAHSLISDTFDDLTPDKKKGHLTVIAVIGGVAAVAVVGAVLLAKLARKQ